jgi:hypothetical protein
MLGTIHVQVDQSVSAETSTAECVSFFIVKYISCHIVVLDTDSVSWALVVVQSRR